MKDDMATTTIPARGDEGEEALGAEPGAGTCGVLGQIQDPRIQLMGLFIRTHRGLMESLGQELEESVGISSVFFDVLIHVGAAPDGRITMSRLSTDVALTTGGVTRLVDRMADAGLVARENCPSDRRSVHVVLTPKGHDVLGRAVACHIEGLERHLMEPLTPRDRDSLQVILSKVFEANN
jgi:DNA-binding MarR family transcriptional regulator